ncbi:P-loop NTPase fold protein [Chryseobacterium sp. MMS23-Vi53]|uniref:P-loop NTPase fold protein n=1 Tax=Chryseobacterium sp. MMS23-Vi53 TaxID=3386644 RepID=UPI0039E88691
MSFFNKIIIDFLSKSSDYAIQLTGNWGVGKTFFYKNVIEKLVGEIKVYNNATKSYKPIYISLFGLKSIEEIQEKIVFELFESKLFDKYKENKVFKITKNILKIGLKGFLNFNKIGTDFNTEIKDIGQNVLGSNELFICFDDLERINSKLDINDFIGYVNSLVDEGVKVLIITNENINLDQKEYKDVKEKVIGITINFDIDKEEILENIISERYKGFNNYKEFLIENMHILLQVADCSQYNYRNLKYALDNLHYIYLSIKKDIIDVDDEIRETICQKKN